jgi:hypothetical protein
MSVNDLARQVSALDISSKPSTSSRTDKSSTATVRPSALKKQTSARSLKSQTSGTSTTATFKRPASPIKKFKPTQNTRTGETDGAKPQAQRGLADIGRYDGGLDGDDTEPQAVAKSETVDELALNSSMAA